VKHKVKRIHFVVPPTVRRGCAANADEAAHAP
jgi:hypothetical protein